MPACPHFNGAARAAQGPGNLGPSVRATAIVVLLGLLAGAGLLLLPGDPEGGDPAGPSVVLITLDTLRADAVGPGKNTPAIERFLEQATWFRAARTPAPLTVPAHVSLLSGLLPARHGLHDNAAPPLGETPEARGWSLLAEEFLDAHYDTAAFVAVRGLFNRVRAQSGFETFDIPEKAEMDLGYQAALSRVSAPLRWLRERASQRPFFLWVHFFDPHMPYFAFEGDEQRPGTKATDPSAVRYAGEVRRTDRAVGQLLDALGPDTIVVLASDHGESMGEHGEFGHGRFCYATTLDVLLAVRAPGLKAGAQDRAPRSLCDVAPSLRKWCGLPARDSDGGSLDGPPLPVVVSEALYSWRAHGWGQILAAYDGRYSLLESGPRLEIFDRKLDPGEERALDPDGHVAYEPLDRALLDLRSLSAAGPEPSTIPYAMTPYGASRNPVKGYLPRDENAKLVDPVSRMAYLARLDPLTHDIRPAFAAGNAEALIQIIGKLRELAEEEREDPSVIYWRAYAEMRLGVLRENDLWLKEAIASALEAVARGHRSQAVLNVIFAGGLRAQEAETGRAALAAAVESEIPPDLSNAEFATQLALKIGDKDALALGRTMIERARGVVTAPEQRRALDELEKSLDELEKSLK